DVAAVYSFESAGRGGVGGYLVSDSVTNWLTTSRLKMLVGYPMEGVSIANQGTLHATVASNLTFVPESPSVYSTMQIRGYPALAGGPIDVLADDGNYYPAAIYLGPCASSNMANMVRILDTGIAELITRADLSGAARYSIPFLKG